MAKETVYKCDRCGLREKEKGSQLVFTIPNGSDEFDLCTSCTGALGKWLEKSNGTTPGGRGPDWEEVCHHHVPCGGACADPHWRKVINV